MPDAVKTLLIGLAIGAAVVETYEWNRLPYTGEVRSRFEPDNDPPDGCWVHQIGSLSGQRFSMHSADFECDICGPVEERPNAH